MNKLTRAHKISIAAIVLAIIFGKYVPDILVFVGETIGCFFAGGDHWCTAGNGWARVRWDSWMLRIGVVLLSLISGAIYLWIKHENSRKWLGNAAYILSFIAAYAIVQGIVLNL